MSDHSPNSPFDSDSNGASTTPLYSPVTTTNIYHAVTDLGYPTEYVASVARALDEFQLAISAANHGRFLLDQLVPQAERFEVLDIDRVTGRNRLEDLLFFSGPYAKTILTDAIGIVMPEFEGPATGHSNPMSPTSFGVDDEQLRQGRQHEDEYEDEDENRHVVGGSHEYGYADIDVDIDFTLSPLEEDRLIPGINSDVMRAEVQQIAELAFVFYRTELGLIDDIAPVVGSTFTVRSAPHDDIVMAEPGPRTVPLPNGTRVV
ncbi:MAG: hypothetical protein ACI9PP_002361 [Halobacteriales archaeon]|jgi:hypothetical protein